jgi:hypothetical protein
MAVTTLDGLVGALAAASSHGYMKSNFTARAVGSYMSMWKVVGLPGAGATPTTGNGSIPDDTTAGAFLFTNAAGAANNYLGYISASCSTVGTLTLYDRVFHNSGLSATATTNQAITTAALTRYTTGAGVMPWFECYTVMGSASAATLNFTYTDDAGNTGQAGTWAKPAVAPAANEMFPLPLLAGDQGIRAITGYSWSVTQTSGDWGFTFMKPIVTIPLPQVNAGVVYDAFSSGLTEITDDACLAMVMLCGVTAMGSIQGDMRIAKG